MLKIDRRMGLNRSVVMPIETALEIIRLQDLHREQREKGLHYKATRTFRKLAEVVGGLNGI